MSLMSEAIAYPRFLMIDTIDTAGIDDDRLIPAVGKIQDLLEIGPDLQIILTTALGQYPVNFKEYVVVSLSDADKLLKKKASLKK